MKNMLRASALALLVAGVFSANMHRANASLKTVAMNSAVPVPTCPPDGTTDCGLSQSPW